MYSAGPAPAGTSGVPAVVNPTATAPRTDAWTMPRPGSTVETSTNWRQQPLVIVCSCLNAPTGTTPARAGMTANEVAKPWWPLVKIRVASSGIPHASPPLCASNCELEPTIAKSVVHAAATAAAYPAGLATTCTSTFTVRPARPPAWLTVSAQASTPRATGAVSARTATRICLSVIPVWPVGTVVGVVGLVVVGWITTVGFGTATVDGAEIGVELVVVVGATLVGVVLEPDGVRTALFPPPPVLSPTPTPMAASRTAPRTPATINDLRSTSVSFPRPRF